MTIKSEWSEYLCQRRAKQMYEVFARCPEKKFKNALELGAGNGFVSRILSKYCQKLICTDINPRRLEAEDTDGISYQILDAEKVGEFFEENTFDLVFSSNMLEHLPNCNDCLKNVYDILEDDGISIHLLPNPMWKFITVILYWPNRIVTFIDKIIRGDLIGKKRQERKSKKKKYGGNNQKLEQQRQPRLSKLFFPRVHGTSKNTLAEFKAFSQKRWVRDFESAGFFVMAIEKSNFDSGYGFGFGRLCDFLRKIGFSTNTVYYICKSEESAKKWRHFLTQPIDIDR